MENKKVSVWKQCKPYMAGLQLPLLLAVVAAIISSIITCLLYTSPSPRDTERSRMPSSA